MWRPVSGWACPRPPDTRPGRPLPARATLWPRRILRLAGPPHFCARASSGVCRCVSIRSDIPDPFWIPTCWEVLPALTLRTVPDNVGLADRIAEQLAVHPDRLVVTGLLAPSGPPGPMVVIGDASGRSTHPVPVVPVTSSVRPATAAVRPAAVRPAARRAVHRRHARAIAEARRTEEGRGAHRGRVPGAEGEDPRS